jgi:CheY-like chemotaxis protein
MLSHQHVLVADDDPELLDAVVQALEHLGANVVRARSGSELIEQLATAGPFDLIVTDIRMPWMDGLRAIQSTRAVGLATAVIVMTALTDDRIAKQVRALGENAILLRKPFDLSELESAVSMLLSPVSSRENRRASR